MGRFSLDGKKCAFHVGHQRPSVRFEDFEFPRDAGFTARANASASASAIAENLFLLSRASSRRASPSENARNGEGKK